MRRAALMLAVTLSIASAIAMIGQPVADAQQAPDPRIADLVQIGKLRVGLGLSLVVATKDSATGELRGVAVDLARALAKRLRIELVPVIYPSPPAIIEGLKDNAWDVGFLAIDPVRLTQVDLSPPYLQIDATFLVPADSSIRGIADADQAGVRIAVTRNSVEEIALRRTLTRAEIKPVELSSAAGFDLLRAGNVEVLAATRHTLLQLSSRLAGSRVLDDRFGVIEIAMAVPKGHPGRLAYTSAFVEEAKASGLVQEAIERAGLRGIQVAPVGESKTQ
jgi:polar amino acid transport system substrate-binding protein